MTENIKQNTKRLRQSNVLGKRDFIENIALYSFISLFLTSLFIVFCAEFPGIGMLWTICLFFVFYANVIRRIRDIAGNNKSAGYYASLSIAVIALVLPFLWIPLFVFLMVKEGKIVKDKTGSRIATAGIIILNILLFFILRMCLYAALSAYSFNHTYWL